MTNNEEDKLNHKNIIASISNEKIQEILRFYDLGEFKSFTVSYRKFFFLSLIVVQVISGGLANTNSKLETTKGFYLMKICEDKTYEELFVRIKSPNFC